MLLEKYKSIIVKNVAQSMSISNVSGMLIQERNTDITFSFGDLVRKIMFFYPTMVKLKCSSSSSSICWTKYYKDETYWHFMPSRLTCNLGYKNIPLMSLNATSSNSLFFIPSSSILIRYFTSWWWQQLSSISTVFPTCRSFDTDWREDVQMTHYSEGLLAYTHSLLLGPTTHTWKAAGLQYIVTAPTVLLICEHLWV